MNKLFLILVFVFVFISGVSGLTVENTFFNGFEDSTGTDENDFNSTTWAVEYGNDGNEANPVTSPVFAGTYAAHMEEGDEGEVAISTQPGILDLTGREQCNLTFYHRLSTNQESTDHMYVDVYDGSWNYGVLDLVGEDYDDATWRQFTVDLSSYTMGSDFRIRFDTENNADNEEVYIDNVNVTCLLNEAPVINNISSSHTIIKGGNTITFSANTTLNGVNDTETDTLFFYCDSTTAPTSANTDCTGGITSDSTYEYSLTCSFDTPADDANHTEYCRVYDGTLYSDVVNFTYETDSTVPSTSINSVAGDTVATYYDTVNDGATDINVSGEASMACRWSSSDLVYSSMANECTIGGSTANCSVNDVASEGLHTRYVSCQDQYANEQNTTQNLDIQFFLDYTAPTTSDNSVENIQTPDYTVTITEADNVDSDPTSYYCTASTEGCSPTTLIDNGGTITYTSSNRGVNYLRYYSVDDAGNTQTTVNKTININQLPVFTSAADDATTIKGGTTVNITTVSSDPDSGQEFTLWVCNTNSATSSGCGGTEYCNATTTANASCTFTSETDSATHIWYAFIYDEQGEAATNNPQTGSYITDSTSPTLAVVSPTNSSTITQSSLTLTVLGSESLNWAGYSINGGTNITMNNISGTQWSATNSSIADGDYNVTFYGNDSYGNFGSSAITFFTIDTAVPDTTAPEITIISPLNNTYYTSAGVLFNVSSDENLVWAGYSINEGALSDLTNNTGTVWNATITLTEGQKNITMYGNDSSGNQGNDSLMIYVDLTNPGIVSFTCNATINDNENISCSGNVSDGIGLNYAIIGNNATGTWSNSSQISLSGNSSLFNYTITSNNTSPGGFNASLYLFDLSGRTNTTSFAISVLDDTNPIVENISYVPNSTLDLDPGVQVNITVDVFEDYNISTVYLMYKNESATDWTSALMSNTTAVSYNATFTPQNGTWQFRINATDSAGNENVSSAIEIVVNNDTTDDISTTISDIESFTLAQASGNNSLGNLLMNNTGDVGLTFNVTLTSSSIGERLFLNGTTNQNASYVSSSGDLLNITVEVNTTSLPAGLYDYTISSASEAGTTSFNKQLNVQSAAGAYLVTTIGTYSANVDVGDTGVSYISTVQNLGTANAENVYLNWTLPSQFTVTSGNESKNLGNIPIGGSGTNTITVSVSGSAANVNVTATATADGNLNSTDSKDVTIGTPSTTTVTTGGVGGGGGGGVAGGGAGSTTFSRIVEIVRGEEDSFEIEVENTNPTVALEGVTLDLDGFFQQYLSSSPTVINRIAPGDIGIFTVDIEAPSYSEYEEHNLTARIRGQYASGTAFRSYSSTQRIRLIIQEVSREDANNTLIEAENAINTMGDNSYYTDDVEVLLIQARERLENRRNKDAKDLGEDIISIKDQALLADNLIRRIFEAENNPWRSNLLIGNVIKEFDSENNRLQLSDLVGLDAIFSTNEIRELITLSVAAFERGDYLTALERAEEAKALLLLERKGNLGFFFYLYWPWIILAIIVLSIIGVLSYRKYEKSSITRKIEDINKEEENLMKLFRDAQNLYFLGKISSGEYHRLMDQHNNKLASLRKKRVKLRNRRIKMLKSRDVLKDLKIEVMQIESGIQNIQRDYYVNKKIGEKEYKLEFKMQNERLAEIEDERTVINLAENRKKLPKEKSRDSVFEKLKKSFKKREKEKLEKEQKVIKKKVRSMLKKKK